MPVRLNQVKGFRKFATAGAAHPMVSDAVPA